MYEAYVYELQELTKDISIYATRFYFSNPIYEKVTTYGTYWWGEKYVIGTQKKYNFDEKIASIKYTFKLNNEAAGKGSAIASAIKTEIETAYNVKMESNKGQYVAIDDNGLSFAIDYSDYYLALYVSFDSDNLRILLSEEE